MVNVFYKGCEIWSVSKKQCLLNAFFRRDFDSHHLPPPTPRKRERINEITSINYKL